jgi:hypothetical protein
MIGRCESQPSLSKWPRRREKNDPASKGKGGQLDTFLICSQPPYVIQLHFESFTGATRPPCTLRLSWVVLQGYPTGHPFWRVLEWPNLLSECLLPSVRHTSWCCTSFFRNFHAIETTNNRNRVEICSSKPHRTNYAQLVTELACSQLPCAVQCPLRYRNGTTRLPGIRLWSWAALRGYPGVRRSWQDPVWRCPLSGYS